MLAKNNRIVTVEDLLNDPMTHLIMKADKVNEADLRRFLRDMKRCLHKHNEPVAA